MKKASFILLKISGIIAIVCAIIFAIDLPIAFAIGFSRVIHEMLVDAYNDGYINAPFGDFTGESFATTVQTILVVAGFVLLIETAICVVAYIISSKARKEATRGLLIAAIILGPFTISTMTVGGILGLIALNKEQPKE